MGQCFKSAAEVEQILAQIGAALSQPWIQLDGPLKMFERRLGLPQRPINHPDIGVRHCIVRTQGKTGFEVLQGFVVASQRLKRKAQIVVRFGVVVPELQGHPATAYGAIELASRPIGLGEIGVERGYAGSQGHGPVDQLDGPRRLPLLVENHAQ